MNYSKNDKFNINVLRDPRSNFNSERAANFLRFYPHKGIAKASRNHDILAVLLPINPRPALVYWYRSTQSQIIRLSMSVPGSLLHVFLLSQLGLHPASFDRNFTKDS